jgi:hypothetical protein
MLSCITFTTHSSILVNKTNSVHNLFLVYLSFCTCFGRLCVHNQEKQLCLCDTWYLLFCVDDCLVYRVESSCVDDCLVYRVESPCIPDSHPHRVTSTKFRINTVISPDDCINSRPKHKEIDKYTNNKFCTELALFTIIYRMHGQQNMKHSSMFRFLSTCLHNPPY